MAVISCERAWELLSQQLDEPLSPQEKQELEEHLAACPPAARIRRSWSSWTRPCGIWEKSRPRRTLPSV